MQSHVVQARIASEIRKLLLITTPRVENAIFHLQFRPGSEIPIADALSRLHSLDIDEKLATEIDVYVHQISRHLPVIDEKILRIHEETSKDRQLRILAKTIHEGWPKSRKTCWSEARPFWNIQHKLSTNKGIIFKGKRLVIPKILQPDILRQLHAAHLGVEKAKQRARMLVYWPGQNADIEQYVRSCQTCARNMPSNQREPMISHTKYHVFLGKMSHPTYLRSTIMTIL